MSGSRNKFVDLSPQGKTDRLGREACPSWFEIRESFYQDYCLAFMRCFPLILLEFVRMESCYPASWSWFPSNRRTPDLCLGVPFVIHTPMRRIG